VTTEPTIAAAELAGLYGVTPAAVRRLAAAGCLPGRKVDGRWRFVLAEVEQYVGRVSHSPARQPRRPEGG